MRKSTKPNAVGLRTLLRLGVIIVAMNAKVAEQATLTPSHIIVKKSTSNVKRNPGGSLFVDSPLSTPASTELSELVNESTTIIIDQPNTSDILDTTIWVWHFSWDWVTIVQLLFSLIGLFGNLLVIVVMNIRKSTTNSTDIFIAALAVSDMLTSLFIIPLPTALQVPTNILGGLYCRFVSTDCLTWICVISSSYILVGASFERLVAVVSPLRIKEIFTKRRVYVFIIIVWVFSFLSIIYYPLSFALTRDTDSNLYCIPSGKSAGFLLRIITLFNFIVRLVIPTVLLVVSQTAMAISLHIQSRRLKGAMSSNSKDSYHILARDRIIKMMLVVIIIYVLCWAPGQIAFLIYSYGGSFIAYVRGLLRQVLNVITFVNSSINPFIYAAHYPKFRSAIKDIIKGNSLRNMPLFGHESN